MTKPRDLPPDDGKRPARSLTPQPEVTVPVEELVTDADPTLEWSISEFAPDGLTDIQDDAAPAEEVGDGVVDLTSDPVFRWGTGEEEPVIEPPISPFSPLMATPEPDMRRNTPPPLPPQAILAGHDNGVSSGPIHEGAPAARLSARKTGPTPAPQREGGSDEELVILETPPMPMPAYPSAAPAAPMSAASDSQRNVAKSATPPPVPPGAMPTPPAAPILLPDIPMELTGAAAPGAWPEALSQRPRKKRLRPWFEEVFDEDYLRTLPFMTAEQTLREVAFIRESLAPPHDGHVLDIACGYGRHAIELSQRGLRVTGLDLSLPLLIRAADESQRRALSVNFVHADMREMAFDGQFDGAYCVLSSFGYFDEETNLRVAASICRALRPGGRFLLDTLNRDYIVSDLPTRVWWEGDGCVVLEEVDFNFHTSRVIIRRSVVFQDGRQVEQDISIRAYSLHELGKLLRQAGFRVLDVSGSLATKGHFFGATSRNIIMVCERPAI
jgi:SAM-dependent methyltransferase